MSRLYGRLVPSFLRATTAKLHTTPTCNVNITFIEKGGFIHCWVFSSEKLSIVFSYIFILHIPGLKLYSSL